MRAGRLLWVGMLLVGAVIAGPALAQDTPPLPHEQWSFKGPFGTTVAHGFLSLSLLPYLLGQAIEIQGTRLGINYGLNRVRFTGPLPAGSRVRARFRLAAVEDIDRGAQMTWNVTVEREGEAKPVLVAEWITRRHE